MNIRIIILLLGIILNLVLVAIVYFKNKKALINKVFAFFVCSVLAWIICNFFANYPGQYALLWNKLTFFAAICIALNILIFSVVFPKQEKPFVPWQILIIAITTFLISVLILFTDLIIKGTTIIPTGVGVQQGSLYFIWPIYFLIYIIIAFVIIFLKYRKSKGTERNQLKYLFLGLILSFTLGTTTNLIIPFVFKNDTLSDYGPYSTFILVGIIAYAILAHHLFDIRVIIKKTLVYSGLLAFVLVTYALIVMSISIVLSGQLVIFGPNGVLSLKMFVPNLIAAILIAVGFNPLEKWLSDYTDKWLFKGEYKEQEVLSKLSDNLSSVIDLDEALFSMMKTITGAMRVKSAAVFVLRTVTINKEEKKETEVKRIKSIGYDMEDKKMADLMHAFIHYFQTNPNEKIVITEELERKLETAPDINNKELADHLKDLKAALVMPIKVGEKPKRNSNNKIQILNEIHPSTSLGVKNSQPKADPPLAENDQNPNNAIQNGEKLIGIMILGNKLSGDIFSEKDLNLLDIAVKQTAAAIEKAKYYEEDQLKSEFITVASHELNTPIAIIMGRLDMVLNENFIKLDKKGRTFLMPVYDSVEQLAIMVKDLLDISRIEGGRLTMLSQTVHLEDLISAQVLNFQNQIKEKPVKLVYAKPTSPLPSIAIDPDKIKQVITNLITNALKFTEKGSITIRNYIEHNQIVTEVKDTGQGIPKEKIPNLFHKFYQVDRSTQAGTQGMGFGLYISKSIIDLHKGKIWAESELGKGSTFFFSLPIINNSEDKK